MRTIESKTASYFGGIWHDAGMSKAFTKDDDTEDPPILPRPTSLLPPGARNFMTAQGEARMRGELSRLLTEERPPLVAQPDDSDAKRDLQALDQRIFYLQASLRIAEVVSAPPLPHDSVHFGATVKVRENGGTESVYRIVGVDEADVDRGWVSWVSPIARALLNARLGQQVAFKTPRGLSELVITGISYG